LIISFAVVVVLAFAVTVNQLPAIGAGALLHPARRPITGSRPAACHDETFTGEGLTLKGWRCPAAAAPSRSRSGTLVYLHGIADNRTSGAGAVERFNNLGLDVIAYDSRAHGESAGDVCTYGFFEKQDLRRVLDTVAAGPMVLFGTSLGAAVALQEAADDPRVTAIVAAETFSDLRTVAIERAPFFFTSGIIRQSFQRAEQDAGFRIEAVSPMQAATKINVPVLLVHGADDVDTPADHSRRVLAALAGPKRLILVPGARHNESLRGGEVWRETEVWLKDVVNGHTR
jgi:uncharacterized protein